MASVNGQARDVAEEEVTRKMSDKVFTDELAEGLRAVLFIIHHHGKRLTKDFSKSELESWRRYLVVGESKLKRWRKSRGLV